MGTKRYPRTEEIMVLVRKAVNTPHGTKDALKHLEAAHDAVERLERDLMLEEGRYKTYRDTIEGTG